MVWFGPAWKGKERRGRRWRVEARRGSDRKRLERYGRNGMAGTRMARLGWARQGRRREAGTGSAAHG